MPTIFLPTDCYRVTLDVAPDAQHPITILAGLPSAAVGALATLMLFGQ